MNTMRTIVGFVIILMGVSALFDFPFLKILFALALIYIGYTIITGKGKSWCSVTKGQTTDNNVKQVFIFSGIEQRILSRNLEKAEVVAVFGGGELDLSEIKTEHKTVPMEFVAIFGGLKIILPKDWNVRSEGVGIVGGFSNKAGTDVPGKPAALIKGVAIFGGVEIVKA